MNILQFFCSLKSELPLKKIVFLDWTLIEFNVVGSYKLEELVCSSNTFTSQFHYVNILEQCNVSVIHVIKTWKKMSMIAVKLNVNFSKGIIVKL